MAQRVAVVGIGQTEHTYRKTDINDGEMINEAARAALADAQLSLKDVDAVLLGNMDFFEGHYLADAMFSTYSGACGRSGVKLNTGGTVGTVQVVAGCNHVASGLFDTVMVIGWEKHDEFSATAAMITVEDAVYDRPFFIGAITPLSQFALEYMNRTGAQVEHGAMVRAQASKNAARNPYAHVRTEMSVEDVMQSRMVMYPLSLYMICPTSCGACAVILASEEKAKKISNKPVWVRDHITVHREGYIPLSGIEPFPSEASQTVAARKLFKRSGITKPRQEIQVFEMYDPSAFAQLHWTEKFLLFEEGEAWRAVEKGVTSLEGEFPISPSGGVLCTNPIGASGVLRVAEAALQIREDAGEHQVTRVVNQALVSGWGGADWTDMFLLTKSLW